MKIALSSILAQTQALSFWMNIRLTTNMSNVQINVFRDKCMSFIIHLSTLQVFSNDSYQGIKGRRSTWQNKEARGNLDRLNYNLQKKLLLWKALISTHPPKKSLMIEHCHALMKNICWHSVNKRIVLHIQNFQVRSNCLTIVLLCKHANIFILAYSMHL